jgi:hypothetical protein
MLEKSRKWVSHGFPILEIYDIYGFIISRESLVKAPTESGGFSFPTYGDNPNHPKLD